MRYFTELAEVINEHTREELRDEIATIQADIDEWKREFGVDSREELESALAERTDSEAVQWRNRVRQEWEQYEDSKRLLGHALELYDDACDLYGGEDGLSDSTVSLS